MHPPTALSLSLAACDSLIDEDLDLNPTVLAPPSSILVRGRRLEVAHSARCPDTPHRHGALPHQLADYGLGAIFTQFLIHGRSACRVGEALHLNDVPVKAGGRFRQLFQLLLVLIRDRGAAHFEFYGCLSLHIVVVEPVEAISVLLDVINVLLDLVTVGSDSLLVARNRLLIRRDVLLIGRDAFFVAFDGYNVGS